MKVELENGRLLHCTSNSQQHRSVLENHTVGYIDLNRMYIDAANRGMTVFRLDDFLDDRQWMRLTHVYLPKNNLLKLPQDLFSRLPNLRWLDLRWNDLSTIPQSVRDHSSMRTLLLQSNNIERLPLELGTLPKLRCLSVLNNPLEFPSKNILSQLRTNKDLINYIRKCWQEQSIEVPVSKTGKKVSERPNLHRSLNGVRQKHFPTNPKLLDELGQIDIEYTITIGKERFVIFDSHMDEFQVKRRRPAKKLAPLRKVKDHTEVICRLRNSGRIKDQVMAQKMLHDLELEQKLVQSFKDQDVLKKWRDKYREAQGSGTTGNRLVRLSSSFRTSESLPQRNRNSQQYPLTRDIDQAISNLNTQLAQNCIVHTSNDPEEVIQRREQEIETMGKIKKKILYLKHHC